MAGQATANSVAALAQKNPEQASIAVLAMKDDSLKSAAMFSLVTNWFYQDSMSTSKWVNSIKSDTDKDMALKYFIPQLINKNEKSAALQWANQIKSEEIRNEMLSLLQ